MAGSDLAPADPARDDELARLAGSYVQASGDGRGVRVALVCARFNGAITQDLLEGALRALSDAGTDRADITVAWVPGAFEIPLVARAMILGATQPDVVIALGAVVRGDTPHFDFVAGECARGLQEVQLATGRPVVFGVLTTNTLEQARARSGVDDSNKGAECARTALEMVQLTKNRSLQP